MELLLTDEQRLLQDSVSGMLAQAGGVKRTRGLRGKAGGFEASVHARWAAEGWLSVLVPEDGGGLGLGLTELALIQLEVGRALAPEPIGVSAVMAAVVAVGEACDKRDEILEQLLKGEAVVVPALPAGDAPPIKARWSGASMLLDGRVSAVALAPVCDGLIVGAESADGPVIAYVPRQAEGLTVHPHPTVDGRPFGTVSLTGVQAHLVIAKGERADAAVRQFLDLLLFAASAELVGVMSAALDMTVEYLKTRKQFGKLIGSFQALQHRAADDLARLVSARSFVFQVAGQGLPLSSAMASALKAHCGDKALEVTRSAIQMHGAIGFTDEHDIGLYLKRAMWLSAWLGNAAVHRRRFIALSA